MANDIRHFDFKVCPWCNAEYKDYHVLKVQQDQVGICQVSVMCDNCGTVYRANRKVIWEAEAIGKAQPRKRADSMTGDEKELAGLRRHFEEARQRLLASLPEDKRKELERQDDIDVHPLSSG